jgi:hypothetical protein
MWLSDRTCDYDGWEGKPPNRIHFVSDMGHVEYTPVTSEDSKKLLVGLDAENIRLRVVVRHLTDFFLQGSCAACPYYIVDGCKAKRASDECKIVGELRTLGMLTSDWIRL